MEEKHKEFIHSFEFMRLGQAIHRGQWQSAAMILRRLEQKAKMVEFHEFDRQFLGLRQMIGRKNALDAKQILALITNKRAKYMNEMNSSYEDR